MESIEPVKILSCSGVKYDKAYIRLAIACKTGV